MKSSDTERTENLLPWNETFKSLWYLDLGHSVTKIQVAEHHTLA